MANFKAIDPILEIGKLAKRVELIKQCANEEKSIHFDERWLSVLIRCAEWHSSQPLCPDLYREPGGAFRWTVELAYYAMRLAGGQKFGTTLPSEERRRVEPQYNYGVFIAAACSGLDEPYRHFRAIRVRDKAEWNPSAHGPLNTWLSGSAFHLVRRETPLPIERMRTSLLAQMIVGHDQLSRLDAEVVSQSLGAINPSPTPMQIESVTHKVVRQAVKVATDFDLKAQRSEFAPVEYHVPPPEQVEGLLVAVQESATVQATSLAPAPAHAASILDAPEPDSAVDPVVPQPGKVDGNSSDPRQISLLESATAVSDAPPPRLEDYLKGSNMIIDFFKALKEDVEKGKATVEWTDMGLRIPKKIVGSYGIASDTLINALRKKGLLLENVKMYIAISPKIGQFVLARETA